MTGVQTCALPICVNNGLARRRRGGSGQRRHCASGSSHRGRGRLIEKQLLSGASPIQYNEVTANFLQLDARNYLIADRKARLHPVGRCDDGRAAPAGIVDPCAEQLQCKRSDGGGRRTATTCAEKRIEPWRACNRGKRFGTMPFANWADRRHDRPEQSYTLQDEKCGEQPVERAHRIDPAVFQSAAPLHNRVRTSTLWQQHALCRTNQRAAIQKAHVRNQGICGSFVTVR